MTLSKRDLRDWEDSAFISFTQEQERIILDCYGEEPEEFEWSEQDIVDGVRKILWDHPKPPPTLPF